MEKVIDDRYEDVDFSKEERYVFGAVAPDLFGFADFESSESLMTDDQIEAEIDRIAEEDNGAEHLITRIYDQKREGSCVANACAQAHQIIQARQLGKEHVVELSAISLYKRIGRSPSSGAVVSDGLREMESRGILPLDNAANREKFGNACMPNTGFGVPFPADWQLTGKRFASVKGEWYRASSVRAYYTALCKRYPIIVGREGHAICQCTPVRHKGRRASQYANSWSERWGFADAGFPGGFGVDTERQVEKSVRNGAFVLRAVVLQEVL